MTIQQKFLISIGFSPMSEEEDCTLYKKDKKVQSLDISIKSLVKKYKKFFDAMDDLDLKGEIENEMESEKEEPEKPKKRGRKRKVIKEEKVEEKKGELPFDDVLIESDQYMYLADFIKSVPLPVLRRISYDGKRFYFEVKESGEVVLYSSGTTLISDGYVDTSGGLDAWRLKQRILGKDPDAIAAERADFGTIMHFVFGCLLMNQRVPFSVGGVKAFIRSRYDDLKIENERIDYIMDKYAVELLEDIRSFLKWVKDYNVKPLAIELMLRSEKYQVASAIDLICEMDYEEKVTGYFGATYQRATGEFKKGDPKLETRIEKKRIVAVVDFKSNRDGNFYPSYALQLELYRRMIGENFGDLIPVERIYNFAPKGGWSDKRNYHFRERTDDRELKKADCVFEQGRINHIFKEPKITYYIGNAGIDDSFDLDSCVKTMKLVDYLQDPTNWK